MNWVKRLWEWHMWDGGDEPWVPQVRWFYGQFDRLLNRHRLSDFTAWVTMRTASDVLAALVAKYPGEEANLRRWRRMAYWMAGRWSTTEGQAIRQYRMLLQREERRKRAIEDFEAGVKRFEGGS